jgi:hypothetical protein
MTGVAFLVGLLVTLASAAGVDDFMIGVYNGQACAGVPIQKALVSEGVCTPSSFGQYFYEFLNSTVSPKKGVLIEVFNDTSCNTPVSVQPSLCSLASVSPSTMDFLPPSQAQLLAFSRSAEKSVYPFPNPLQHSLHAYFDALTHTK